MYAEERQQAMAESVVRHGRASVAQLATEYDVTTETVRRDLSTLERLGLIRRVHGGAVPAGSLSGLERALSDRAAVNIDQKERVARTALPLLPPDGSTILLDAGSTTARLAALLPHDLRLVVVTHAMPVAAMLAGLRNLELHVLPGRVRHTTHAAVGIETVEALQRIRADVAFLGVNGVTPEHGCSTPHREEAAVKRSMTTQANRVVVLADASKLGVDTAVRFADLEQVDDLVTDETPERELREALNRAGTEVVVA